MLFSEHGTFSNIDHMLVHKTVLNKFKEIEVIPSKFPNLSGMKLEIKYKKQAGKQNTSRCTKTHATELIWGQRKK